MNEILNALKCCNCHQILSNPILLPCSHAVCKIHSIHSNEASNKNQVRCKKCFAAHLIPPNGEFNRIEALDEIIEAEIDKSNLIHDFNQMSATCKNLKKYSAKVENMVKEPVKFVHEELDEMKKNILSISDELKLKIDKETKSILDKIDTYKQNKLIQITPSSKYKNVLNKLEGNLEYVKKNLALWDKLLIEYIFVFRIIKLKV